VTRAKAAPPPPRRQSEPEAPPRSSLMERFTVEVEVVLPGEEGPFVAVVVALDAEEAAELGAHAFCRAALDYDDVRGIVVRQHGAVVGTFDVQIERSWQFFAVERDP